MAVGEVVMWPNDISILGRIKLDVYMLSRENTGAVSTSICDAFCYVRESGHDRFKSSITKLITHISREKQVWTANRDREDEFIPQISKVLSHVICSGNGKVVHNFLRSHDSVSLTKVRRA